MPDSTTKTEVKEVKAYARHAHISPRKARLVAELIKKISAEEAIIQLSFLNKKAALLIRKLLESAVANASHNFQLSADRLFVKSLTVDGGPVTKRFTPKAQGRATPIRKQTSHISLVLGVSAVPVKSKRKAVLPPPAKPAEEKTAEAPKAEERKTSRFGFFKKKEGKPSQVPPKEDPKGHKYTGFDRRSGS